MSQDSKKQRVAEAALEYIETDTIVGLGSGNTVNVFIAALAGVKSRIDGVVAGSTASETLLREYNIPLIPLNSAGDIPVYVDSADEATKHRHLIKGGGGALTREKIIAAASDKFICIIDDSKLVGTLGGFPLAIEVIPMAQSHVARELVKLGGQPILREKFTTDNGNIILDVHNLKIPQPLDLERKLDHITGIVANGIFANRPADVLLIADDNSVRTI